MEKYALHELSPKTIILYESCYRKYVKQNANIDVESYKYLDWIKFFDDIRETTSKHFDDFLCA